MAIHSSIVCKIPRTEEPSGLESMGSQRGWMELQADSLPTEPPGNLKNIGVGSLSLLQDIFLT